MPPRCHGRLRVQNTHLGIGKQAPGQARPATPNGGYALQLAIISLAAKPPHWTAFLLLRGGYRAADGRFAEK